MNNVKVNQRAFFAGVEHRRTHGDRPDGPLSGAWAGESIPELSARYGLDLWDDIVADCFEDGFYVSAGEATEYDGEVN